MQRQYFLPRGCRAVAAASLRHHSHTPFLKITDSAARAMSDFQHDPLPTVAEELTLEKVLDEMFRLSVRALLVVRDGAVVGLVTAECARARCGLKRLPNSGSDGAQLKLCVADVMTAAADLPAVDWQMIKVARICDLIEIFEGSGVQHLVVLENETPSRSNIRGLIHRERLERQLGTRFLTMHGLSTEGNLHAVPAGQRLEWDG